MHDKQILGGGYKSLNVSMRKAVQSWAHTFTAKTSRLRSYHNLNRSFPETTPIMHKRSHWVYLVMLVSIASLLILLGIGWRYPWPADERGFALVAKEMVETGQWFFPTRGGEYYPDKPPVFMWSIAVFYWLTGKLSIAFLRPSALSAV